jgi:FkbM family methyltransferase
VSAASNVAQRRRKQVDTLSNKNGGDDNSVRAIFAAIIPAYYRPGTTDENALREVLIKRAYRKASVGFDVESGEHWLDLGANIGAFALYCQSKGATAECYEPMPDNFELLRRNVPKFKCYQTAISNLHAAEVPFWTSRKQSDHYRGTLIPRTKGGYPQTTVKNMHASHIQKQKFDGLKLDIEGSEFGLIDEWLLPQANKLVLEYHLSRDNSLANLARRVLILRRHYQHVVYCPELARLVERGTGTGKTYFDRSVYCWGARMDRAAA